MGSRYASGTNVPIEQSKAEIEGTLRRYGADGFQSGWRDAPDGRRVEQITFMANGRTIRFQMIMPAKTDDQFVFVTVRKRRQRRSDNSRLAAWEQHCRQLWRALALCIKAKLEAIAAKISEFDNEFLAFIVDPVSKKTVAEIVRPQLDVNYGGGGVGLPGLPSPEDFKDGSAQ